MESPDKQYKTLVQDILDNGIEKSDRTGVGTISIFGAKMQFDLSNSFPLLTSKRVFFRGVAEELLWMLQGKTDAKQLDAKGVKIWNPNASREFLDSRGLDYDEGELGPVYGFQWRHFGAAYQGSHQTYTNKGVDQVEQVLHQIKHDPDSRRIILSAWNPAANDQMALPACHCFCQFYVDKARGLLSCQLYQRSGDVGLGVPFNIASYALLTCLFAKMSKLKPYRLVHIIGDAHIYKNHIEALKEQMISPESPSPILDILSEKSCVSEYMYEDFKLTGYNPAKQVRMKMAV